MSLFELFVRRPVLSTVLSLLVVLIGVVSYTRLTRPRISQYRRADRLRPHRLSRRQRRDHRDAGHADPGELDRRHRRHRDHQLDQPPGAAATSPCASGPMSIPTSPPPMCATASAACAAACPTRSTSRSSPRSRRTRSRSSIMSLTSSQHNPLELTDFADRFITDRVQNITGVAEVQILGERRYAMRIWLDRARMAAYNVTVQEIEAAIRAQNVEIPVGPHREQQPRIHGAVADRPDHAGAVPADRRQGRQRLSGQAARRRPRRAGRPGGAQRGLVQWPSTR